MATVKIARDDVKYAAKYHAYHKSVTSKFDGFTYKDPHVTLIYNGEISEEEVVEILAADANYLDADPFTDILRNIIFPARIFGQKIINEFALLRNKWLGITKALDQKQWQITNIVKLRVAGMEDAHL
jgi:hypothetical protein